MGVRVAGRSPSVYDPASSDGRDGRTGAGRLRERVRTGASPVRAGTERLGRGMMLLFGATVFLGAGLLFLVQPMVAKMVLPLYGGSPQVWNTSMLFFQAVLLAGYAATHLLARLTTPRRHAAIQLVILLLPLLALPITLPAFAAPPADAPSPALWLLVVLGVAVALPFFVVTMTSPTLLRFFSTTDHPAAGDPYFLYAAGNVGSLLALLAYPFIVEPNLATTDQTRLWTAAYLVYAAMFVGCAFLTVRRCARAASGAPTAGQPATASRPLPPTRRGRRWNGRPLSPRSRCGGDSGGSSSHSCRPASCWA